MGLASERAGVSPSILQSITVSIYEYVLSFNNFGYFWVVTTTCVLFTGSRHYNIPYVLLVYFEISFLDYLEKMLANNML